jgi:hypothetical protein
MGDEFANDGPIEETWVLDFWSQQGFSGRSSADYPRG